jgi:DNA-binding transcriptional MocR family regulator
VTGEPATGGPEIDLTGGPAPWDDEQATLFRDCLAAAVRAPDAWRTPPREGLPRLRAAFAAALGLDVERLTVTAGVRSTVPALLAGAARLVIEAPTFLDVPRVAAQVGVAVELTPLPEILDGRAAGPDAVLWVTSPARNPDGWTLSGQQARRLEELRPRYLRMVVNQAYRWCRPAAPVPPSAILAGTVHKLAGGGALLGWRLDPDRPAGRTFPPLGGPARPWQLAWARYAERGGLTALAERALAAADRRACFAAAVGTSPGVGLSHGDGPSLLLHGPPDVAETAIVSALARRGVLASPGGHFAAPGTARLSFTTCPDGAVAEAAGRVSAALAGLAGAR